MARNQKPSPDPVREDYFEPIGAGIEPISGPVKANDGGVRRHAPIVRVAVLGGTARGLAGLGSFRFWATALGTLCAAWAATAGLLLVAALGSEALHWVLAPAPTFLLACMLLPAAAAMSALHWGMSAYRRPPPGGSAGMRMLAATATAGLRGLVLAPLILVTLLLEAGPADQPGSLAWMSAGVAAGEGFIFGGMGAAVAGICRRSVLKQIFGAGLALFLVAGTVAAAEALAPVTRSDEPVTVALNVKWASDGSAASYQCSTVFLGFREVYHTDRIMWLPAASPSVLFVMLAGKAPGSDGPLGWLSGALQEAADGTTVPCVNGEPRSGDTPGMPLAVVGLLVQAGIAAGLIGWAHAISGRRAEPGQPDASAS